MGNWNEWLSTKNGFVLVTLPMYSIVKEIRLLSLTRRCFNGIVLIGEIINHVIQKYVKGVRCFDSLRVFIKHAYEQYDAVITFIQIVYTFHI